MFKIELDDDEVVALDKALSLASGFYRGMATQSGGDAYMDMARRLVDIQNKLVAKFEVEVVKR